MEKLIKDETEEERIKRLVAEQVAKLMKTRKAKIRTHYGKNREEDIHYYRKDGKNKKVKSKKTSRKNGDVTQSVTIINPPKVRTKRIGSSTKGGIATEKRIMEQQAEVKKTKADLDKLKNISDEWQRLYASRNARANELRSENKKLKLNQQTLEETKKAEAKNTNPVSSQTDQPKKEELEVKPYQGTILPEENEVVGSYFTQPVIPVQTSLQPKEEAQTLTVEEMDQMLNIPSTSVVEEIPSDINKQSSEEEGVDVNKPKTRKEALEAEGTKVVTTSTSMALLSTPKVKPHNIKKYRFGPSAGKVEGGLSTDEIEELFAEHTDRIIPVIPSNKIHTLKLTHLPFGFIMNLDRHTLPGSHWVACFIDNHNIEYFNSFGEPPTEQFKRDIIEKVGELDLDNYLKFKYNTVIYQNENSSNCGWFCLDFLDKRFKGIPFKFATNFTKEGERNIEKFKERWEEV